MEFSMLKLFIGIIVLLIVLIVMIQPEWFKVLTAVFYDFIQANEK